MLSCVPFVSPIRFHSCVIREFFVFLLFKIWLLINRLTSSAIVLTHYSYNIIGAQSMHTHIVLGCCWKRPGKNGTKTEGGRR